MRNRASRDARPYLIVCLLLAVFVAGEQLDRNREDLVRVEVRPGPEVLRVMAAEQERLAGELSPFGPGFEQELVASFAQGAGYVVEWLPSEGPEEALRALREGRADLVVGHGGDLAAGLPQGASVVAGPAYAHYRPVLVQARFQGQDRFPEVRHLLMPHNPQLELRLAPYLEPHLNGRGAAALTRVPHRVEMPTVLNSLQGPTAPVALLADARFKLWQPFYLGLQSARTLPEEVPSRWYWRKHSAHFSAAMASFWAYHRTETRLAELTERYFGFFPGETPYYELETLYRTINEALPQYADLIAGHSRRHGIDPLLLTALIYQESRFDPQAKSHRGAKGLLQFTSAAADYFKLADPFDPAESIRAGSDYLGLAYGRLEELDLEPFDRWCFTLAAYNQGLGHLRDAVALAKRLGLGGRTWHELKTVFPLLEEERFAKDAAHGTCRGSEAVRFVDSVRYYYYILHGIVRLARPEAQHLGPLLYGLSGGAFAVGEPLVRTGPLS